MTRSQIPCFLAAAFLSTNIVGAEDLVSFRADIAPILQEHCLACHDAKSAEGGYQVDSYDAIMKPGESGVTPIARKEGEPSELLRRLTCEDESERMPSETDPLAAEQIKLIKSWIDAGSKFDGEATSDPLAVVIPAQRYADPPASYAQAIPITAVCFAPDGKHLLASGYHELTLWNIADGQLVRRITNIGQRTFSLAMTEDGKTIAAGCGEPGHSGELRLIDFDSGEVTGVIGRSGDVVLSATLRPGSDQIAIASADGLIRIVNVKSRKEVRVLASHADAVTAVAWSDDGKLLASASRDKSIRVFESDSGQLHARYTGHGDAVRSLSILADGKQVVSTGEDNKIHRWNISDAKQVAAVDLGSTGYKTVRSNDFLIIACEDHRLQRFNLDKNNIAGEFSGHKDWAVSLALDQSGTRVASGSFDGEARVWNIADGSPVSTWIAKP